MVNPLLTIFHMSDVHIGEPGVDVEEFKRVIALIERKGESLPTPLLLITGDLTSEGLKEEFETFHEAIDGVDLPLIIIPGNHDERNYGAMHFERLFGPRFKTYETETVAIFAADSAEPDNDAGHVGRAYYSQITEFFTKNDDKIKIFALHHHLIPVPHTGREHNVVEDAGDVLGTLVNAKCNLVLNGHRHVPWMWQLNNLILFTTGTLLSRRIRGAVLQAFTIVTLTESEATFTLCQRDGTEVPFAKASFVR